MVFGLGQPGGWGWLGVGSAVVVGVTVACNRRRRGSASQAVLEPRGGEARVDTRGGVLTEPMMAELLLPSRTSVVVCSGVAGLSTIHLFQTSLRHCVVAGIFAGCAVLAGRATDAAVGDEFRIRLPFLGRRRRERAGKVVKTAGLSATGVWLTTQITQELVGFAVLCGIATVPVIDELADAWHHHRGALDAGLRRTAGRVRSAAAELSPQCQTALHRIWDRRGLGRTAGAEVCGDLLEDYAAELADVIRANTQRVLAENFAVAAGSGVATAGGGGALPHEVVATLSSVLPRAVRAFATSALIGPWVEARLDGPVDKAEFVMFYDDACMSSLESLVTLVGAGGTAPGTGGQLRHAFDAVGGASRWVPDL